MRKDRRRTRRPGSKRTLPPSLEAVFLPQEIELKLVRVVEPGHWLHDARGAGAAPTEEETVLLAAVERFLAGLTARSPSGRIGARGAGRSPRRLDEGRLKPCAGAPLGGEAVH